MNEMRKMNRQNERNKEKGTGKHEQPDNDRSNSKKNKEEGNFSTRKKNKRLNDVQKPKEEDDSGKEIMTKGKDEQVEEEEQRTIAGESEGLEVCQKPSCQSRANKKCSRCFIIITVHCI